MKQELTSQYSAIRQNIQSNVQTIGLLIKQAHSLRELVEKLNGGEQNEDIKKKLEEEIECIEDTIAKLITQTDTLFDSYNRFVEQILSK